jgi:hypothetical protein
VADLATWAVREPRALAYAEITANQTGIAAEADVAGLSITFVVPAGAFWVECWAPNIAQQGATGIPVLKITDGSNNEYSRAQSPSLAAAAVWANPNIRRRISDATPGASITLKVRLSTTAGTADIRAGQAPVPSINGPAFIRAWAES